MWDEVRETNRQRDGMGAAVGDIGGFWVRGGATLSDSQI